MSNLKKKKTNSVKNVTISQDLFTALLTCYSELASIHKQFGDYPNAKYSKGLKLVSLHATKSTIKDMQTAGFNSVELEEDILKDSNTEFDYKRAARMLIEGKGNRGKNLFYPFTVLTPTEIMYRVKKIYMEHLGIEENHSYASEKYFKLDAKIDPVVFGADSIDLAELIMAFEEEFNFELPDNFVEYIRKATFQELADTLDHAATLDK